MGINPTLNSPREGVIYNMPFCLHRGRIERFSFDLEMKTRAQNRNNKRTEIHRFDWFIKRTQTRMVFLCFSGEKTSCPRTF